MFGSLSLIAAVDGDASAVVGPDARGCEVQPACVASPADRVERLLGDDLLSALECDPDVVRFVLLQNLDSLHTLPQAEHHAVLAQQIGERVHDLAVDEREQSRAAVHQCHPNAERGEHRGILAADDSGSDHGQSPGQPVQRQDVVAGDHPPAVEGDVLVARSLGPGCDDDLSGGNVPLPGSIHIVQPERVLIDERRRRCQHIDAVAQQLCPGDVDFMPDDGIDALQQVRHLDPLAERVAQPVEFALAVSGEVENRLAQGLRRDCTGVD